MFGVEAAAVATYLGEILLLVLFAMALRTDLDTAGAARALAATAALSTVGVALVLGLPDVQTAFAAALAVLALPILRLARVFERGDGARLRQALALGGSARG
jgi:hypothetical protein